MKKTFTLFWLTGEVETIKGNNISEAFTLAGYSGGAMGALDFYGNGDCSNDYVWDKDKRTWHNKKMLEQIKNQT